MELNEGQKFALEEIKSGKSCFITGQGGTGKTFLIKEIFKLQPNVAITALTGCAAFLLNELRAKTIHGWSGIGLGNDEVQNICLKIIKYKNSCYYNWMNTDILVIDEISMMEGRILDKLNAIGKKMRNSYQPFGGITIVFVGDFFQLPPVKRDSSFAFESNAWKEINPTVIVLEENMRQSDDLFRKLLSEIRKGCISEECLKILSEREKKNEKEVVCLFPTKNSVETLNSKKLDELVSSTKTFFARSIYPNKQTDFSNEEKKMDEQAPYQKELKLKVGARVMLVYNLNVEEGLVNGSCGTVVSLNGKYPEVNFDNQKEPTFVQEAFWESPNVLGLKRIQIPLICCWALTIHKSQGLTLNSAFIDLKCFAEGQAYVALSRVASLDSLFLTNVKASSFKTSKKVIDFYSSV